MGDGESSITPTETDPAELSRLEALPLHSTDLLTLLDERGVVQYESPAIERIYGFEQSDLIGDQVADYFHPEDRKRVVAAFEAIVASDKARTEAVEYRHEQADGTYTWVESVASANPTPEGYYVVNSRDISDRKRRERTLRRQNERLAEFADILTHDLRNPLNVAEGHLELLAADGDTRHLAEIERAHDRMRTLIDDMLSLAKDGAAVSAPKPVRLDDLVEECWKNVASSDATLVNETHSIVLADETRLSQLVENLVRNSVEHGSTSGRPRADDAIERGGSSVTITVGELDDGIYLEDDGDGIPESERATVFDSGYSTGGGTGLGLSIVATIAGAHGWDVDVVEGSEGGARFEITGVAFVDH